MEDHLLFQEEEGEERETVVCIQGAEERPVGGDTARGEGGRGEEVRWEEGKRRKGRGGKRREGRGGRRR